jgi:CelD/BcsL family acetyltransferase involved in cellulose biosynthesis
MRGDHIEIVGLDGVEAHLGAWRELSARALEPNAFAEPAFVVRALQTFARADRLKLLLIWRDASKARLIGAVVLKFPSIALGFGVARIWQSDQAGLAALMLDRDAGEEALAAIVEWISRQRPEIIGLLAPSLDASGPTALAAEALGRRMGAPCRIVAERSRAVLNAAGEPASGFESQLPKKRLKEWGRQMRRLKERGAAALRIASDDATVEQFLALEAKGWKGAQRTALGLDADLVAFTRSMLAAFAAEGRLAIHLLELDGEAIAAGLVLRSGARAFYWKTAYDESYAEYSPGVQLTLELSRALEREAEVASTDSCAIEGHPMIGRLWPGRLKLADRLLPTRAGTSRRLAIWVEAERARTGLREFAKGVINPLRGRKRS